jgi:hypothetical protein
MHANKRVLGLLKVLLEGPASWCEDRAGVGWAGEWCTWYTDAGPIAEHPEHRFAFADVLRVLAFEEHGMGQAAVGEAAFTLELRGGAFAFLLCQQGATHFEGSLRLYSLVAPSLAELTALWDGGRGRRDFPWARPAGPG